MKVRNSNYNLRRHGKVVYASNPTLGFPDPIPSGGGTILKTLRWNEVFGAQNYVVEIGTSPGASNIFNNVIGTTNPQYTISLTQGITYYFRVRSVAANGPNSIDNAGPASSEFSFVA